MFQHLDQQIEARCPCFALLASECQCQPADPDYKQMLDAIQQAHSWLAHAHQLMLSQGISAEEIQSQWPVALADSLHYCGQALSELFPD